MIAEIAVIGAALLGYEGWKRYKAGIPILPGSGYPVIPGHLYVITYKATGQAGAPTVVQAQSALDTSAPQLWTVYVTQPSTIPGSFVVTASFDGPGNTSVTTASLSSSLPGCTATTVQDMGAPTPAQVAQLTAAPTVIPPPGA